MRKSIYNVTLTDGDWVDAYFELRITPEDRPFHLVFRKETESLALNAMTAGEWGSEESHPCPVPLSQIRNFTIQLQDTIVEAVLGGERYVFEMSVSANTPGLLATGSNTTWTFTFDEPGISAPETTPASLPSDMAADASGNIPDFTPGVIQSIPELDPISDLADDTPGEIMHLQLAGRRLTLPDDIDPETRVALSQAAQTGAGAYLQFLTVHPILQTGAPLTVLDIDPKTAVFALIARILLPQARVLKLSALGAMDQTIDALLAANDLGPIACIPLEDIASELADGAGPVLLQGGRAFGSLGHVIDTLPEARRKDLSLWTSAREIIPGQRIFPCANAQISVDPGWVLSHNAAVDLTDRRHGIDVAIAAYNAGEYLIDCATSLLCEGRNDVRVIIVDDGSSDGSGEIAAQHFADEPRVRVERKPNGGCASARNYGRLVSDATHIAFVDADDFVTPGFFADLYDLALYSGCEITQAGFDFYDDSLPEPYYPSYEEEIFQNIPRESFKGQSMLRLASADIIKGQPTIWRKVYRRDFLDAKNIYFPENVRAYDDYIFQIFSLTAARDIVMLPQHKYHYRQHPAQDIKQGDERHFYMLFMFQMMIKRAVAEGWPNFRPYAESIIDSISWSSSVLRPDLVDGFLRACGRFCVGVSKTFGPEILEDLIGKVEHPDFAFHYRAELEKAAGISSGPFWAYFNGELYHPDIVRMHQAMQKAI